MPVEGSVQASALGVMFSLPILVRLINHRKAFFTFFMLKIIGGLHRDVEQNCITIVSIMVR